MLLILSSASRVEARYGVDGASRLRQALVDLAQELGARRGSARLVFPDDPLSMSRLGLSPMDVSSGSAVRASLAEIRKELPEVDAVLIVGGDAVVPFYRFPNPVRDRVADPDPEVLTDNAYGLPPSDRLGASLEHLLSPEIPVGRLPDAEPPDVESFLEQICGLLAPRPTDREGTFAVVDESWTAAARGVLEGDAGELRVTPGWHAGDADWRRQRARLCYFNLHGFDDRPTWQGFHRRRNRWVDGVRPSQVTEDPAKGAVVFAENCYGALVTGRSPRNSVALAFLAGGARAFVGSTGLAFGSYIGPLTGSLLQHADLLGRELVTGLRAGRPFGRALLEARNAFVRASSDGGSIRTTFAAKTGLQFVLYGNPLAKF